MLSVSGDSGGAIHSGCSHKGKCNHQLAHHKHKTPKETDETMHEPSLMPGSQAPDTVDPHVSVVSAKRVIIGVIIPLPHAVPTWLYVTLNHLENPSSIPRGVSAARTRK